MVLGPLLLVACAPIDEELFGAPVDAAWLEEVHTRAFTVFGGPWGGTADLIMETGGFETLVPVTLRGGTFGFGVEVVFHSGGRLALRLPDREVTGNELFGHYAGSAANLTVVAGVEAHHLHNAFDVAIEGPTVDLGVGLLWGSEWLALEADLSQPFGATP